MNRNLSTELWRDINAVMKAFTKLGFTQVGKAVVSKGDVQISLVSKLLDYQDPETKMEIICPWVQCNVYIANDREIDMEKMILDIIDKLELSPFKDSDLYLDIFVDSITRDGRMLSFYVHPDFPKGVWG